MALATARAVFDLGLSNLSSMEEIEKNLDAMVWDAEYYPYRLKPGSQYG